MQCVAFDQSPDAVADEEPRALAAAAINFVELRTDAHKLSFELRRPRYEAAKDVGAWWPVLRFLSWLALIVNVLIMAYTSTELRDNLLGTMLDEWKRTGYFWEQYDPESGRGQRTHPFNGWSSLAALMLAEVY